MDGEAASAALELRVDQELAMAAKATSAASRIAHLNLAALLAAEADIAAQMATAPSV